MTKISLYDKMYFLFGVKSMKIIGKLCDRIDTIEGKEAFKESFDLDPYQYFFEYEPFHITRLFEDNYKYLVFLEYDADPRQVFYIEPGEHIMVYNDIESEIFNTDQMAFFSLIRDGNRIATFCTEHSPWSFRLDDKESLEEMEVTSEEVLEKINTYCKGNDLEHLATIENTLIVRNL